MARRLILDTGVLIASERARSSWTEALEADDDVALAAVSIAELRAGVELADAGRRKAREAFLEQVLAAIPAEPYDLPVAQVHGRLLAAVHRQGTQRGAHDLIIAATAVAARRTILTSDRRARFGDLPDVECLEVGETP